MVLDMKTVSLVICEDFHVKLHYKCWYDGSTLRKIIPTNNLNRVPLIYYTLAEEWRLSVEQDRKEGRGIIGKDY